MSHRYYLPVARDSLDLQRGGEESELEDEVNNDKLNLLDSLPTTSLPSNNPNPATKKRNGYILAFIIISILNAICCFFLLTKRDSIRFSSTNAPRRLRMPNQFYGLAASGILKEGGGGAPWLANTTVITFPTLLQQVDRKSPGKVFPEDPRRYRSSFGTLSPEDRPLYVSSSVSTIAQFRVRDYRMERCRLKLNLPEEMILSSSPVPPLVRQRDWVRFSGSMNVRVSILESKTKGIDDDNGGIVGGLSWIDPRTLNFRTRQRKLKSHEFETLIVKGGEEVSSEEFDCPDGSILSFELSCEDCLLDVWQDKEMPPMGLFLEQRSSL